MAATNQFDASNAGHVQAMKDLYASMESMTNSGNNTGAANLYNEKQAQYGFGNLDFSQYGTGGKFDANQIGAWSNNSVAPANNAVKPAASSTYVYGASNGSSAPPLVSGPSSQNTGIINSAIATPATVSSSNHLKDIASNVSNLLVSGDNAGAYKAYTDAQKQYGFSDAEMSPNLWRNNAAGTTNFTADEIGSWKNGSAQISASSSGSNPGNANTKSTISGVNGIPTYQATQTNWVVNPSQTVQSQASGIIAQDGELMQRARSNAEQQMNSRGLINSSMGINAGQSAVLAAATDIAKQDANTYASANQANAAAANSISQFNSGQANSVNSQALDRALTTGEAALNRDAAASNAKLASEYAAKNAKLENDFKIQAASDAGFQKQYEMYVDALYKIDQNKDLDAPAKEAMKAQQAQALKSYSAVKGLGLDLNFLDPVQTSQSAGSTQAIETDAVKQAKISQYESAMRDWTEMSDWARMGKQAPVNPYPYVAPKYA